MDCGVRRVPLDPGHKRPVTATGRATDHTPRSSEAAPEAQSETEERV